MTHRIYLNMLIFAGLYLIPQIVTARPSPAEKAAARSAFWGLFADVYLAQNCFEQGVVAQSCALRMLSQTGRHAADVDAAASQTQLGFAPPITAIKKNLQAGDLISAKTQLSEITAELIRNFAASAAPAVVPDLHRGSESYAEHCASCHAGANGGAGALEGKLKIIPQPLNASWRQNVQTPLGVYATLIHGVDGSEMLPLVDVLDIDELWSIAFYVATLTLQKDEAPLNEEFVGLIKKQGAAFSLVDLARSSNRQLIERLNQSGYDCGLCSAELSYLRRDWLALAPRLGDYAKDERQAREARGLTILITLIAITSIGFGVILGRRSRVK